jgi:hypothetical protein
MIRRPEAVFQVFNYVDKRGSARNIFGPFYEDADVSVFMECDWKSIDRHVKAKILSRHPSYIF